MTMTKGSSVSLRSILKVAIVADLIWAFMFAVLQGLILNQAGIAIEANGAATAIAAGGSAFMTFFQALFIGAVFQFFAVIILAIWAFAFSFLTKDATPAVKKTLGWIVGIIALAVLGFAFVQAATSTALLVGIGTAPAISASTGVLWAVGILSFIITFCIGVWQGMIFATIGAAFLFVGTMVVAFFSGRGKGGSTGGTTTGGTQS
jgi:hypothetical protein